MKTYAKRLADFGGETVRSGFDAGSTIAMRTPMFWQAGLDPFGEEAHEVGVAVSEKAKAAWDGAVSAQAKLGELWLRAAFGCMSINDAATAWLQVCDAAMKPARKRVRSNAKRLTGV